MKRFHRIMAWVLALTLFAGSSHLTALADADSELETQTTAAAAVETEAAETTEALETTEQTTAATETETQPEAAEEATLPQETEETEPEETTEEEEAHCTVDVPAYTQEDYPDVPFGNGSLAKNGNAVTALAMVATYLTGYDYTPDALADIFRKYAEDDSELIAYASKAMGLTCRKAADFQETYRALERGCVVLCKMNSQSVFADDTHMIVLKEATADGRIFINDPSRSNQEKPMLQDGFQKGFPKGWISTGWEEAWIFDPEEVPEDVPVYCGEVYKKGQVPVYNQLDYKDVRYGAGTIATSGCGITALAMVATAMTGHTYYPDELADYFGGYNGNNIERLLYASDELRLPWHQAGNWHMALNELKEGNLAIILTNGRSMFSNEQHFIVATGVTEDGKVMISDPYGPNYNNPVLKDGFANGFTTSQIATGYSGAWVYDLDEMPEDPYIYIEEEKPYIEPRYGDLTLSDADMELLARLVWVEARGEDYDGQQAVAEVILNRVVSDQFASTVHNVIYAADQFLGTKYIDKAEPTQTQYEAVERALYGPYILPIDVTHFATYPVNKNVWGTIGGHTFCYQWSPDSK